MTWRDCWLNPGLLVTADGLSGVDSQADSNAAKLQMTGKQGLLTEPARLL
ncbi:hypothetical protein GCM10022278_10290 [Allohahella marinimesophila]|uniref:Uncharacterized protein n=1 Tax=Allohahella marinimesophila TaxID=1054972 RepID=A0ABP7NSP5_9GAMM